MSSLPDFFLINPVNRSFVINERFNAPRNYTFAPDKKQLHEGVDVRAIDDQGQPVAVLASQRGLVDKVAFSAEGYGNYVRIVHEWGSDKWVTWYGHMSDTAVREGQFVLAGQKIGIAGTTGFSTGIHLHVTLQHIGHGLSGYTVDDVVDPEPFFRLGPAPSFDEASFLADVTVVDGTVLQPGQMFQKTWRIRNTGTTAWDTGYTLAFAGQDHMGGPDSIPLPSGPVQAGQAINVSVALTAPGVVGVHRSTWQLRDAADSPFPNTFYAEIEVKETKPYDEASYVADVTVEDGTIIQAGDPFVKTWRVRNTGTTTWTKDYSLRFLSDEQMGGPDRVPMPREAKPGEVVELSVSLKASTIPGRHRSTWKLYNPRGKAFEYEQYAEIQVPRQAAPTEKLSELRFVADVTVPDETLMQPGEKFIKTWRVRNTGETAWGSGYTLAFHGDDQMGGPGDVPLPSARPGDMVEVSVPLVAPSSPGVRRSTWKPRDPKGNFFEFDLFALITVADVQQPAVQLSELSWVADVTVPDGTVMQPGEAFVKTWRIRNTGTTAFGTGHTLAFFGDDKMDGPDSIPLPHARPGDVVDVTLMLTAPASPGLHKSTWKGRDPGGTFFEYDLFALVEVVDPSRTFDLLPYLRGDGRLYELQFSWDGGGRQRVQTQVADDRFYFVKGSQWEELWSDDHFIYRGTDTSAGGGEVYTLTESGKYGSAWVPRQMSIGVPFRRTPLVVFRRKSDGSEVPGKQSVQVSWIQLQEVHKIITLSSGIQLADVAVLGAYEDANGKPKDKPFERYFYAREYGLVSWEGNLGQSVMVREFPAGSGPDNKREVLAWLT
ncbi:MAG TPA: NBR1-Ig-like domain-containing protein [Aggregatilineaceae bacterium]|nr:NBR1-Ig-like domain-containing protein [Aggregatilineaceae bacterium]